MGLQFFAAPNCPRSADMASLTNTDIGTASALHSCSSVLTLISSAQPAH